MAPKHRKVPGSAKSVDSGGKNDKKPSSEEREIQTATRKETGISFRRSFYRFLLCISILGVVYFFSSDNKEQIFASQSEQIQRRAFEVPCSSDYDQERLHFKGCAPRRCGRLVMDELITPQESSHLLQVAKKGMSLGGSAGGASILDLHSGALSHGSKFVNIYKVFHNLKEQHDIFTDEDFAVYRTVKNKIHNLIGMEYGISPKDLHLTHPTFFSRMTSAPSVTPHDEYWHVHVDKQTYKSFHYTSLLYLSDYGKDFTGGRFVFVGKEANATVEPKMGRVSLFTSGSENPHFVEKVISGTRYALTVSFSCDKQYSIPDPSTEKFKEKQN